MTVSINKTINLLSAVQSVSVLLVSSSIINQIFIKEYLSCDEQILENIKSRFSIKDNIKPRIHLKGARF